MTTINKDNKLVTLINVFTVEPAKQQQLIDLLIHATKTAMRHVPGFISANIHRSLDGTKSSTTPGGVAWKISKL